MTERRPVLEVVLDDELEEAFDEGAFEGDGDGTSPSIALPFASHFTVPVTAPQLEIVSDDEVATALLTPLHATPLQTTPLPSTRTRKPSGTGPAEAAVEESVVVPQWKALFGRAMVDRIEPGFRGRTLDAAAGTGYLSLEILRRMGEVGRVVAIESDTGLLEVLRRRASAFAGTRFFARAESPESLSFGDEVFDIAMACTGTSARWLDPRVVSELRRVVVPNGRVLIGIPLHGTFEEIFDMFRDVALRVGDARLDARIETLAARDPHPQAVIERYQAAGFRDVTCAQEERQLSFRTVAELFTHPLIRAIALPEWRALCGFERESAEHLVEVERTFATYLPKGPVTLRVRLGTVEAVRA